MDELEHLRETIAFNHGRVRVRVKPVNCDCGHPFLSHRGHLGCMVEIPGPQFDVFCRCDHH